METQQSIAIQEAIIQVNKLENSREKSLILTKLQEAGLWLYELENGIH
jgi:hypothetical protein